MRALVCSTMPTFVLGGPISSHESTKPRRMRASEGVDTNAEFLAGGVRGWLAEGCEEARVRERQVGESLLASRVFQERYVSLRATAAVESCG